MPAKGQKFISENGFVATVVNATKYLISYRYDDSEMVYCALPSFWDRFFSPV